LHADLRIDRLSNNAWQLALAGTFKSASPVLSGPADAVFSAVFALLQAAASMALDERPTGSILLARWLTLAGLEPISSEQSALLMESTAQNQFQRLEPPFGRFDAATLIKIAEAMQSDARLAILPGRTLGLIGKSDARLGERLGWITNTADPRRLFSVCTGAPACAHGFAETIPLAQSLANAIATSNHTVHVSGCAKGCALREQASLTIAAGQGGFYMRDNATAAEAMAGRFFANEAALLEAIAA
jgi:precorrin-3B synthase